MKDVEFEKQMLARAALAREKLYPHSPPTRRSLDLIGISPAAQREVKRLMHAREDWERLEVEFMERLSRRTDS
jgi:hypothetical protein